MMKLRAAVLMLILVVMGGCVYLPKTTTVYDDKCQTMKRQMSLEVHQLGVIAGCSNESCVAALVVFGAVSAATAVVSGSVMVVGNVVYWLEKQGHCIRQGDASISEDRQ
jgi:hypothetical protein